MRREGRFKPAMHAPYPVNATPSIITIQASNTQFIGHTSDYSNYSQLKAEDWPPEKEKYERPPYATKLHPPSKVRRLSRPPIYDRRSSPRWGRERWRSIT
jgi:hypothetical protein